MEAFFMLKFLVLLLTFVAYFFIKMGCLKLQYYPTTELKIISSKKVLTFIKTENKKRSSYLFGFNGKENDDETQTQDYGMRIYNGRLGKFLSVDPLTKSYPMLTPYQFAGNTPIWAIDIDGLEPWYSTEVGTSYGQMAQSKAPITLINANAIEVARGPYSIAYAGSMGMAPQPAVVLPDVIIGKNSTHVDVKSGYQEAYSPYMDVTSAVSTAGGIVKTTAVCFAVVGQLELAVPLYKIGDGMDDVGSGLAVIDATMQNDGFKMKTEFVGKAAEITLQKAFKSIAKLGDFATEAYLFASDVIPDMAIDEMKDVAKDTAKTEKEKPKEEKQKQREEPEQKK